MTTMLNDLADRVSRLIEEVGRVERETEKTYLTFGKLFSSLVGETERSAGVAEASLVAISSRRGKRGGSAADSNAYFKTLHERDSSFLARINQSIETLSSLDALIGRVRSDSEEMEIISLNAMTVALKSGNAGKAFSVITDELKRLSTRTISLTEEITSRGRALLDYFARLRDALSELDAFQGGFFDELEEALSAGFTELESSVATATEFFGELLAEARGVRAPVQRIMQEVQLQDIVRQSLQHVGIALEEARSGARNGVAQGVDEKEELHYVASVSELSASLIDDVLRKLDASAASFGSDVDAIDGLVRSLGERRTSFIAETRSRGGSFDAARLSAGSASYLELKRDVITRARRLGEQVRGLEDSFKNLAALLSRFQNIVVASRIEVAKNRALSGVTTTVHGMITLTERISVDVGEAMGTTKEFIKVSSHALAEYAGSGSLQEGTENRDAIVEALARVEAEVSRLDGARTSANNAIGGFSLYTPEFLSLIEDAREELAQIRALEARLREARDELGSLRASVEEVVGDSAPSSIHSLRFREMIERFTIFTHKRTAGEIGSFEVEEGSASGEVTLF
jgi:type II secretory pathway component PulM